MNVVLFTWNPEKWTPTDREWARRIAQINDCGFLYDQWSVGNSTKLVKPGDTAFLLRQNRERGIIARGTVTSEVFEELSWNVDLEEDATDNYVEVTWTSQVSIENRLPFEDLELKIPEVNWVRYSSGTTVDARHHEALFDLWNRTVHKAGVTNRTTTAAPPAPASLISSQNGFCGLCGIDPASIYSTSPTGFLITYTFRSTGSQAAVCPNCFVFASKFPDAQTLNELHQLMSAQF